jgi:hypothetical protein
VHDPTTPQFLAALTVTDAPSNTGIYVAEEAIWNNTLSPLLRGKKKLIK